MPKGGLGTGLGAIFGDAALENDKVDGIFVPISKVEPKKDQPRKYFDPAALEELTDSVREHGVISPITVRKLSSGNYQIIAGERRWRAARNAGLDEVPCRIIDADDLKVAEISLIENLQREDLTPIEEAEGYRMLIEQFGLTQEQTAVRVGKSRPAIANALRLLTLGKEIREFLEQGSLSAGHAKALLALKQDVSQVALAQKIIEQGLSVRQAENAAKKWQKESEAVPSNPQKQPGKPEQLVDYVKELEKALTQALGRRVRIQAQGKQGGKMEIEFFNNEDLDDLIERVLHKAHQ